MNTRRTEVLSQPLQPPPGSGDAYSPQQILNAIEQGSLGKTSNSSGKTLGLAVSAGLSIALGFAFFVTATTGMEDAPWGISRLVGGAVFSLGLIVILVCGGELFTSSILGCVPWATQRLETRRLLRNWLLVYLGNLAGALALAGLVLTAKLHELAAGKWGINVLEIAAHKLEHDFASAVALGILCNVMVCLAVWMSHSTRRAGEKALLVILPVALFVSTGFEHVVANMFIVPLALGIMHNVDAGFWQMTSHAGSAYEGITLSNFVLHNLIPVTLGNVIGGLLVGLGYWGLFGLVRPCAKPVLTPDLIDRQIH
ncbi:MAG: formate transporter FocA [Uliginosibacterium sp.]|jgi:formate transporter|nr:formate transporter FocA [Uliginosibacterium sp.]